MKEKPVPAESELTTIALLREETALLHQNLHEHPLLADLLSRPSKDCYRSVLSGFLMFYEPLEPVLVDRVRDLGIETWYPRADRTNWLRADLETIGARVLPVESSTNLPAALRFAEIGGVIGTLYVIKGSALGGETIRKQLQDCPSVGRACRFFSCDGERPGRHWHDFQQFCNNWCRSEEDRRAAVEFARLTFAEIAESLTRSLALMTG